MESLKGHVVRRGEGKSRFKALGGGVEFRGGPPKRRGRWRSGSSQRVCVRIGDEGVEERAEASDGAQDGRELR